MGIGKVRANELRCASRARGSRAPAVNLGIANFTTAFRGEDQDVLYNETSRTMNF